MRVKEGVLLHEGPPLLWGCLQLREPSPWELRGLRDCSPLSTGGRSSHHLPFFRLEENLEIILLPMPLLSSLTFRDEENKVQGHLAAIKLEPQLLAPPPEVFSWPLLRAVLHSPGAGCSFSAAAHGEWAGMTRPKSCFWDWISGPR